MYTTLCQQTFMPADWLWPCQKFQSVLKFELIAKNWNRDRKLNLKMLLCIMCTTEPPIWNIYSWHTLTRRCFSWSCSDKLCVYHHYYKGTSIRRLGHFECCKCFSTPIKGTTTKLLMITMPPKTLSCSSFCMPFKINMNTLCIFTVH